MYPAPSRPTSSRAKLSCRMALVPKRYKLKVYCVLVLLLTSSRKPTSEAPEMRE